MTTDAEFLMGLGGFVKNESGDYQKQDGPLFDVDVQLTGEDGNAFRILGAVSKGIRKAGGTAEDVENFMTEAQSGDYDNLLATAMRYVNVL